MQKFKLNFRIMLCGLFLWLGGMVLPAAADIIDLDSVERADGTKVSVTLSRPVTDRRTRNQKVSATVTNISGDAIAGPLHVVIDQLSPASAVVVGAGDISTSGKSIYTIPSTSLAAGDVATVNMEFSNIGRNRLVIGAQVYIQPPAQAPPVITILTPDDGALFAESPVTVTGSLDSEATVEVNGVEATVDGLAFSVSVPLVEGGNDITAVATNAGGQGQDSIAVTLDTTTPVVTITTPTEAALLSGTPVTVEGTVDDASALVEFNGATIPLTGNNFSFEAALVEGANALAVTATDDAGNEGSDSVNVVLDTTPPVISISSPLDGAVLDSTSVTVTGPVSGAETVVVNGVIATLGGGSFSADIILAEGPNSITAMAIDAAGNNASDNVDVTVEIVGGAILTIEISSPLDGADIVASPVTVTGVASPASVAVNVNGINAPVAGDGSFSVGIALSEGSNDITATATKAGSDPASDMVTVTLLPSEDETPPVIVITSPVNQADFTFSPITVQGTVDDDTADVSVNGVAAQVVNGNFSATVPLLEGENPILASATDPAGNVGTDSISVNLDTTDVEDTEPPVATIDSPGNNAVVTSTPLTVTGFVNDGTATSTLNGVAVPPGAFELDVDLVEGANVITLISTDPAGNSSNVSIMVTLNTSGVDDIPPVIEITDPLDNAIVQTPNLAVQGIINDDTAAINVNGVEAVRGADDSWAANVALSEGTNLITAVATDTAGNSSQDDITVILDTIVPVITIVSPVDGSETDSSTATVSGTVDDDSAIVEINGVEAVVTGGNFSIDNISLSPGANIINARATDAAGNVGRDSVSVNLLGGAGDPIGEPLAIAITSPATLAQVRVPSVDVEGTVDEAADMVMVNGIEAQINGSTFMATDVPLREGQNLISARATAVAGNRQGSNTLLLSLDTTPPIIRINAPADGAKLTSTQATVVGIVNDLVGGPVNDEKISVEINGRSATVLNGSFEVRDLLLVRGVNVLRAVARDIAGNESSHEIQVEVLDETGQQRIVLISGNNQTGMTNSELPQPLVVELQDADGRVLADKLVTFSVVKSDGLLSALPIEGEQIVQVLTDEFGQASAFFTLGSRTGAGNNQVAVSSQGFVGDVIFCESSLPGDPVNIIGSGGANQRGIGGQPLAIPFQVFVTDMFGNPVPETDVEFSVIDGSGNFSGEIAVSIPTDIDGKASIIFTPGEQSGVNNNLVVANISGLIEPVVNFLSSSVADDLAGAENTSFSGVVLDMGEVPIPGATIQITDEPGLRTTTDEDGRFTLSGVPVGVVHLLVDGSTSPRQEEEDLLFTFLAFQATTISGQDNTVGMPIQLPALDEESVKIVGGEEDVVLTMKGLPGVEYTVFANSATLPNGEKYVGPLMLTQIPGDRVPMPPPDGSSPTLFSTLQPANIHFDPPIRLKLPNVEGLAPGQVIEVFSFDHDLEEFVSVGPGSVTPDGAFLVTDPGFGIVKSGWHAAAPPPPPPICKVYCDDKNECTSDRKLPNPACRCEHTKLSGNSCGDAPGLNSCVEMGECFNGVCLGEDKPDGTMCDSGFKCDEPSECKTGFCRRGKPKEVEQPFPQKIKFDFTALNKALEAISAATQLFGLSDKPPKPTIDFEIERTNECCEQKDGAITQERKISGSMTLRTWTLGPIPLGSPPWVWNFDRTIFGRKIKGRAGAFLSLGIGLGAGLSHTKNECVDQTCWAGEIKLAGSAKLELTLDIVNPLTTPGSCERPAFDSAGNVLPNPQMVDCALLLVSGSGSTGLSGTGSADCAKLAFTVKHDGVTLELKLAFLEGTVLAFSVGRSWNPLPAQTIYQSFIALPQ